MNDLNVLELSSRSILCACIITGRIRIFILVFCSRLSKNKNYYIKARWEWTTTWEQTIPNVYAIIMHAALGHRLLLTYSQLLCVLTLLMISNS